MFMCVILPLFINLILDIDISVYIILLVKDFFFLMKG